MFLSNAPLPTSQKINQKYGFVIFMTTLFVSTLSFANDYKWAPYNVTDSPAAAAKSERSDFQIKPSATADLALLKLFATVPSLSGTYKDVSQHVGSSLTRFDKFEKTGVIDCVRCIARTDNIVKLTDDDLYAIAKAIENELVVVQGQTHLNDIKANPSQLMGLREVAVQTIYNRIVANLVLDASKHYSRAELELAAHRVADVAFFQSIQDGVFSKELDESSIQALQKSQLNRRSTIQTVATRRSARSR